MEGEIIVLPLNQTHPVWDDKWLDEWLDEPDLGERIIQSIKSVFRNMREYMNR